MMIRNLYSLLTLIVDKLIWLPALFNSKLKLGVEGRKRTFDKLIAEIGPNDQVLWMHVASLGEFEQGRPVLERLKKEYPQYKILLTFFSPSGFEKRKDYEHADVICYLPLDTPGNVKRFMNLAHPKVAIFVKYEFWPNYLHALGKSQCQTLLISTVIRKENKLFMNMPGWFRSLMNAFDHILTQDHDTAEFLRSLDLNSQILVSGDTRIDRTLSIARSSKELADVADFCGSDKVLVAGSTWPEDEQYLLRLYASGLLDDWKMIIAPHEIDTAHVDQIVEEFDTALKYSEISRLNQVHRILVIDNIGLLNKIYRYAHIAYIGGGFGAGIHNTLEPAAFNLPIIFGPKFQKFVEANELVSKGGAFSYASQEDLLSIFQSLQDAAVYKASSKTVRIFMETNKGATDDVMKIISGLQG